MRLRIEGMTCGHCVQAVTKALSKVAGVARVTSVDLERGEADLEGSPDASAVVQAVKEAGYTAHVSS